MSYTEEQLKDLAKQLSKPYGQQGKDIAEMMHNTNIGMTLATINALNITTGDIILELGHGNCKHLPKILNKTENIAYVGLEISELMHHQAIENNIDAMQDNKASFYLYDGDKISFEDNKFDKILTVNTLYFWNNPEAFIKEVYRVLKPNGCFAFGFADKNFMETLPFTTYGFNLYNREKAISLAKTASFCTLDISSHSEIVSSKTGEEIERIFHVATGKK